MYTVMAVQPWENVQWVAFQGALPKLSIVKEGWREMEHNRIIEVKNKIAEFDNKEEWELRKKVTNPFEAVFSSQGDYSFPSLAKVNPLSRAYFKMIEMLNIARFFDTLPKRPLTTAHICEGPGGFIQYVLEQVVKRGVPLDKVYAMTLKPTKHHIPGWRRSIQFLKRYPKIQLEYGADGTGDILHPDNQRAFAQRAQGSHLFTADGGFDFSVDFTNQERMAFPLLLSSFSIGLRCLARDGMMIIKLFDIYSHVTQDLILGTARLFKQFTIYKPATSRPCNAERYFIATGYIGQTAAKPWIDHLNAAMKEESSLTRLVGQEWSPEILGAIREQIFYQEQQQIAMIEKTIHFRLEELEEMIEANLRASRAWCEAFNVPIQIRDAV